MLCEGLSRSKSASWMGRVVSDRGGEQAVWKTITGLRLDRARKEEVSGDIRE